MHNPCGGRPRRDPPKAGGGAGSAPPAAGEAPLSLPDARPRKAGGHKKAGRRKKAGRHKKSGQAQKAGGRSFRNFIKNSRPSGSRRAGDLSKIIAGAAVRPTTGRAGRRNRPPRRRRPPLPARLPACSRRGCRCRARRSRRLHRRRICGPPP